MSVKNWIKFFSLSIIWGTSFFWIKIGLQETGPATVVFFRVFFATIGLGVYFWLGRKDFNRGFWWLFLFLGFFNVAFPFLLITWSEEHISSGMASILNATQPLATALIATIFIKEERMTWQRALGLLIGFCGVLVLMSNRLEGGLSGHFLGIVAMIVAVFGYASSAVFAKLKNKGVNPESQALGQMSFALLFVTPAMFVIDAPFTLPRLPLTYLAMAWLGLLGSCLASIIWYQLLQGIGPSKVSMTTYLLPLIGIALGVLVLNESMNWRMIAGGILIILGIIIVNHCSNRSIERKLETEEIYE